MVGAKNGQKLIGFCVGKQKSRVVGLLVLPVCDEYFVHKKNYNESLGWIIKAHKLIRSCWLAWARIDGNFVTRDEEILPPINLLSRVSLYSLVILLLPCFSIISCYSLLSY